MSSVIETPIAHTDPINAKILAISEDRIQGFVRDPFGEIAEKSGVDIDTVLDRIRAMLRAGTIRRVRQTLCRTRKSMPRSISCFRTIRFRDMSSFVPLIRRRKVRLIDCGRR